ncbi:MAG: response regulator [Gammaproteobacteria bacterium]
MRILKRLIGRIVGPLPPSDAGAPPAAKSAAMESARVVAPPERAGSRVLLIEDNFVNQRVAVYMLRKLGHQVDVAMHGREAIDILSKERYDLVLMDCQMPEMDGFEATRVIRDHTSAVLDHAVPVVAMTASSFPEDRSRALLCGMNDFVPKPVDRAVLAATLEKWLKPVEQKPTQAAPDQDAVDQARSA